MSANTDDALKICKSLLDNGSRNADVYWKLSSSLYQDGQTELSRQTLNAALTLHPGNNKLVALKEIISSNSTEQELIALSTQLNQNSLDKGALKISCLTKSGEEAISACKQRLELTDVDGDRMRSRLEELGESQAPLLNTDAAEPNLTPNDEERVLTLAEIVEQPELPPARAPTNPSGPVVPNVPDATKQAAEADRKAYSALVSNVQTRLNELGFYAGIVDGVPGKQSRKALADFYTAVGAPVSSSIDNLTLDNLRNESRKLASAEQLLLQSEQAQQQGNTLLATQKLEEAKQTSKLLEIPDQLALALRPEAVPTLPEVPTSEPKLNPPLSPTTTVTIPDLPSQQMAGNSTLFNELMDQINVLQDRILKHEAEQAQQLERIRNAF